MKGRNMPRLLLSHQAGLVDPVSILKLQFSLRMQSLRYNDPHFIIKHYYPISSLDIDCTGRFLLSGGVGENLYIHDLGFGDSPGFPSPECNFSGTIRASCTDFGYETVQWYPFDSGMMLTSGMDKVLQVWDVGKQEIVDSFKFEGAIYQHHMGPVPSTQHSLVGVALSTPKVRLVDIKSGKQTHELDGHEHGALCCQWSPRDEYLLATGGLDSAVLLWDVRSAKSCLASLDKTHTQVSSRRRQNAKVHHPYVNAVKFSVGGKIMISTGRDNQLIAWNMSSYQNMNIPFQERIKNPRKRTSSLQTAGIGNFDVLIAPSDNKLKIFHIQTGNLLNTIAGHYCEVTSCVYQKDRMELISTGHDRQICKWIPDVKGRQIGEEPATMTGQHLDEWDESDEWDD